MTFIPNDELALLAFQIKMAAEFSEATGLAGFKVKFWGGYAKGYLAQAIKWKLPDGSTLKVLEDCYVKIKNLDAAHHARQAVRICL